jgi:hypothetical protein
MGQRERPFVSKPTGALLERLDAACTARLFVVQEPGPTSFVLKAGDSERKHRVSIGTVHTCSCGAREQPCVHVAFVLLRVFRLSATDQRCWQSSLIDSELEALVNSRVRAATLRQMQSRESAAAVVATKPGDPAGKSATVLRRPISEDEVEPCPICYEDLTLEDEAAGQLDWCSLGCGKSLHRRCFAMWAEHQSSIGKALSCPFCRGPWASGPIAPPPPRHPPTRGVSSSSRAAVHRHAKCRSCRAAPITGTRYRCLTCPEVLELCSDCYASNMHAHHPFAARERPGAPWTLGDPRPDGGLPPASALQFPASSSTAAHAPAAGQAASRAEVASALAALQHREIGPEDYDLLLALESQMAGSHAGGASRGVTELGELSSLRVGSPQHASRDDDEVRAPEAGRPVPPRTPAPPSHAVHTRTCMACCWL